MIGFLSSNGIRSRSRPGPRLNRSRCFWFSIAKRLQI